MTEFRPCQSRVMPFFSNLLPEERLREYLARRAAVNPEREFFLLWVLGEDLPGAVTVRPADGEDWPPDAGEPLDEGALREREEKALRFSLAGAQLKFSAVTSPSGGLTIPAKGVGGSWIVKLPSEEYDGLPENEFSMMTLARKIGMNAPALELVDIGGLPKDMAAMKGQAMAIERFDRFDEDELVYLADRVGLAKAFVLDTARETVELFHQHWVAEKNNLPLYPDVVSRIDKHLEAVPLAEGKLP